ncbi:MAG: putative transcriptional regulatory protein [Chlamydiia bacterium]|nr:putative transcriptional regulatory protein [Chlamydiia bacterium]MCH9615085.1 putative transcriptional regulatory protein [Chlamydiia bacterium]MCH9628593.1 putative transcriptional regulatory protein [Chlamydiia bacterium]
MAGHSKWANIKHRKGRADAAKGKLFSRAAKEIISAVKQGGPDKSANAKLRLAIQKARAVNMPNDNIDRNIKKASSTDQADYVEMTYELYGHGGVGIIVDAMTDNKNRTASDMRIATNKKGGSIATPGAVSFNFDRKGVLQVKTSATDEDTLFMLITDAGADDFETNEDLYMIVTPPELLFQVKEAIEAADIQVEEANLEMIPKNSVEVDEETRAKNDALIEFLEDLDDVDSVYHNS